MDEKKDYLKDMYDLSVILLFWISIIMFFRSVRYSFEYYFFLITYLYSMFVIVISMIDSWYFKCYKPLKSRLLALKRYK